MESIKNYLPQRSRIVNEQAKSLTRSIWLLPRVEISLSFVLSNLRRILHFVQNRVEILWCDSKLRAKNCLEASGLRLKLAVEA